MKAALALITITIVSLLLGATPVLALDPSLDVSQYAHTAWTVRDGFSLGNIYSMAQTPDGYLWLGTEFGLSRFDGVRAVQWQPPAGQKLNDRNVNSLLVTRDGTLWIGTMAGLVALTRGNLSRPPVMADNFVASLFEDSDGTLWVGSLDSPHGRLCAIQKSSSRCYGDDGSFGRAVWALYEDSSGTLWAAAQSGLWRIKPGAPKRYPTTAELIALDKADDGRLLIAMHSAGLLSLAGDKLEPYPVRGGSNSNRRLGDHEIDSNRLLRDRDGGLWIGSVERGLIHVHQGRTDVFTRAGGLSGDVILSMFEDREGNVWVASTGGLDRFRELPVATVSVKQGLSSDASQSVLATADGSIWVGSHAGLTRLRNGQATKFNKASGLPDDDTQALYQDANGRLWVSTAAGLAHIQYGRFVATSTVPAGTVHYMTGNKAGDLWLSGDKGLSHLRDGRLVEQISWSVLGYDQQGNIVLSDGDKGGVWIGSWGEKGMSYFKDGQIRRSYTMADGLGRGPIPDLQLDQDGALWVATEYGGLSRIEDGRIATLTTANGLPCNTTNALTADDDRSLWLYLGCGLVRITRSELDEWISDPKHRIKMTVWDAADGVRLRSSAASEYGPRATKSSDGKLWFVTGEGIQVIDPHHLAFNTTPPPVRIEHITADHKTYWQNLTGSAVSNVRLPPRIRDLTIDYTALSLVVPEKVHFKYKLEGQDSDWREVINDREVQYSNLAPGSYRFRVIASNNSGVWNEQGDTLEFSVDPAYYQTGWFRALCVAGVMALLWAAYQLRVWQLRHEFNTAIEARVSERTRIARELHDTLLQSLQALLFQYQAARNLFAASSERAMQVLDATIDRTEQAIAESRDAIQDIRSDIVAQHALPELLTMAGSELAESQADHALPAFGVTVEGERRTLSPIIREETYRIALELLRNAFRHANAHRIETEIRYDDDKLRLRIRDDGKGMDLKVLQGDSSGHWGLRGVRERAERIGAKLDVWSEAGAGTEFELTVPAGIAYLGSGGTLPFRLFRKVTGYAHRN